MPLIDRRPVLRAPRAGRLLATLLLVAGLGWATPVHAGLVFSVPTGLPATAGTTNGFFDIVLDVTGAANVSAFQFSLALPSTSGITFISADTTSPNYIFPGSSGIGWTLENSSLTITAGDLFLSLPGYVPLSDTTVSLGRVYFQVDSAAPGGTVPLMFDTTPTQTLVLDDTGGSLDYSAQSGSIVVTATAVPEPSTLSLAIAGAVLLGGYGLHRRGKS